MGVYKAYRAEYFDFDVFEINIIYKRILWAARGHIFNPIR